MLDIKFIRENPELVKEAARKKHIAFDVENLLKVDDERKKLLQEAEELRAKQNKASEEIVKIKDDKEKQKLISEMKDVKEDLSEKEAELKNVVEK